MPNLPKNLRQILLLTLASLTIIGGGYKLYKYLTYSEKDRIREILYNIQNELPNGPKGVTQYLTADFLANNHITKELVHQTLAADFLQGNRRYIQYHQIDIKLHPSQQEAIVYLVVSEYKGKFQKSQRLQIQLKLKKIQNQWKIYRANYEGNLP